jgi:hypothetical protein
VTTEQPIEAQCDLCSQTRPLFPYEHCPEYDWGFGDTSIHQLCTRCWDRAETAEANDDQLDLPYLCKAAKRYAEAMRKTTELAKAAS